MKYHGIELTEFKSNKNIAFNPKQHMIVWDDGKEWYYADIVGYFPDNAHPFLADNNLRYKHGADIMKPQTNWDLFQERYSAFRLSLETGIEVFNGHSIPCEFCPARAWCTSAEHSNSCKETFKSWAEMEADEEK